MKSTKKSRKTTQIKRSSTKKVGFPKKRKKKLTAAKRTGLFAMWCGILGLIALFAFGLFKLGVFSTDKVAVLGLSTGSVSTTTGLRATSSDAYTYLTWNSVSSATGYKIWRRTGFFGTTSLIYTMNGNIAYYVDKSAVPGKTYYYSVSAFKGSTQGTRSATVKQVASSLSAPKAKITNPNNSASALAFELEIAGSYNGINVYCNGCEQDLIEVSSKSKDQKYYEFFNAGETVDGRYNLLTFFIKKLEPGKQYSFQVSKYRLYDGKRYESKRTESVLMTMPENSSTPDEPSSFNASGFVGSANGGQLFYLSTPVKRPDGYRLSIKCSDNGDYYSIEVPIESTWVNGNGRTMINTMDVTRSSDAESRMGTGTCSATIQAYFIRENTDGSGDRAYSTINTTGFYR